MVRLAVPGFRKVTVCELATPTVTLPKLTLEGTTESCGSTPVPLTEIFAGEFVAVLTTLILPIRVLAADGANSAVSERLWPGVSVVALEKPLTFTSALLTVICETVTFPVPVFFSDTDWDALAPTKILPKASVPALGESRWVMGTKPCPETGMIMVRGPLVPAIVSEIVPLNVAAELGRNVT